MQVERLWHDLHERVGAFVRRRVSCEADAEDIVQDVFVRLHTGLGQTRLDRAEAYVYQVARNTIVDHHRRRRPVVPELEPPDEGDDELEQLLAGCMRPFVEALPEPYREALLLTDLGGLSQAEAARRLGVSASGMRTRVQRGRDKLRELFDACCHIEVDRRGGILSCDYR